MKLITNVLRESSLSGTWISKSSFAAARHQIPSSANRMRGRTFDGFYALSQEDPSESFGYNPSRYKGLKKESLDIVCGRNDMGVICRGNNQASTRRDSAASHVVHAGQKFIVGFVIRTGVGYNSAWTDRRGKIQG